MKSYIIIIICFFVLNRLKEEGIDANEYEDNRYLADHAQCSKDVQCTGAAPDTGTCCQGGCVFKALPHPASQIGYHHVYADAEHGMDIYPLSDSSHMKEKESDGYPSSDSIHHPKEKEKESHERDYEWLNSYHDHHIPNNCCDDYEQVPDDYHDVKYVAHNGYVHCGGWIHTGQCSCGCHH